jgi:phage tail-like protein
MDANGLHFRMLSNAEDWLAASTPADVFYDATRRSLRLASRSERTLNVPAASLSAALSKLELAPGARDAFGTRAYWDSLRGQVMATGALAGAVPIFQPSLDDRPSDLALGVDGVLYLALGSGAVVMLDRRDRWDPVLLRVEGFSAWRVAPDPAGGAWILDRVHRRLARLRGLPFPRRPFSPYAAGAFRPNPENPEPPQLCVYEDPLCPADELPVALACSPAGDLALLTWPDPGSHTRLRVRRAGEETDFGPPWTLAGAPRAYSLAWVADDTVAVLLANPELTEAPVFRVPAPGAQQAGSLNPIGDLYPLAGHNGEPFLHGVDLPPHYPTRLAEGAPAGPDDPPAGSAPLHHLSLPSAVRTGWASNLPDRPLDLGQAGTAWHRLYLEADIPLGCGIRILLAASDDGGAGPPRLDSSEWHEHRFGAIFARGASGDSAAADEPAVSSPAGDRIPCGAWLAIPSEIPLSEGLLACEPQRDRAGLFTVLIQRSQRPVRTLTGRYLWVRAQLIGDGRTGPEIAALRAYAPRFSYLNRYLPQMYRETRFGPDADELIPADTVGGATPADFLERFLDNFEGLLTPLEDRISGAYLLTDPDAAPEDALAWLGGWIGISEQPGYNIAQRRRLLREAPRLFRDRGTLNGLRRALDIATEGAVARREIIVLEDFRLRRTFATILGADLADEEDPLLGGLVVSGNSFVGDTLFLGDEERKEFLALFGAQAIASDEEAKAVQALFDRLAHRVTVLVHQELGVKNLALIRRVVELETPAHVEAKVLTASQRFMVGLASLVGVDTYLVDKPQPGPVRVNRSSLGVRDVLQHPPSLDPRLEAGYYERIGSPRPIADPGPPLTKNLNEAFDLDASASSAAPGRKITLYVWTWIH